MATMVRQSDNVMSLKAYEKLKRVATEKSGSQSIKIRESNRRINAIQEIKIDGRVIRV